jgi:hypothetical protein
MHSPTYKAKASERQSKDALQKWCDAKGWRVVFFESENGSARTGIVDAVMVRIRPRQADNIEIKLVQIKSGSSGLTAREVRRLKAAADNLSKDWLLAAFDGTELHFVPHDPAETKASASVAAS